MNQSELIVKVARESISELTKTKIPLTPDNYYTTFCKIAKKNNLHVSDCNKLSQLLPKLDNDTLTELQKYNLKTTDELFNFLAVKIRRTHLSTKTKTATINNDLTPAVKTILYALINKHFVTWLLYAFAINAYQVVPDKLFNLISTLS